MDLNSQQFPRFEVGDPAWAGEGEQYSNYTKSDKVAPEHFGLRHVDASGMRLRAAEHDNEFSVPTHSVTADQKYVYEPHVRNLAKVPQDQFDSHEDPVRVVPRNDGTHHLVDGHHRAAAALLRGDQFLRVKAYQREA